jgi:hypothetical protein
MAEIGRQYVEDDYSYKVRISHQGHIIKLCPLKFGGCIAVAKDWGTLVVAEGKLFLDVFHTVVFFIQVKEDPTRMFAGEGGRKERTGDFTMYR